MHVRIPVQLLLVAIILAPCTGIKASGTQLFVTSQRCFACHNNLSTSDGEDISIASQWRAAIMAHSAKDPYWLASVRRETLDHPSAASHIEDECATCHMPMMRYAEHADGGKGRVFAHLPLPSEQVPLGAEGPVPASHLAAEGVSCSLCHQIEEEGLGTPASFTAGFSIDEELPLGERRIHGPYDVEEGLKKIMQSASGFTPEQTSHLQSSALCGSCHTLFTNTLDSEGTIIGQLPEQVPFLEWKHSDYLDLEPCQSCHMPVVHEATAISSVLGEPREAFSRHSFRGGNFFMLSILAKHADELGVTAPVAELEASMTRTRDHLQTMAASIGIDELQLEGEQLKARVVLSNYAGHKLPTAYPSRRAWIHFVVRDADGTVVFESGRLRDNGSIAGNDNDEDPIAYEEHYEVVSEQSQVQIYEGILATPDGRVTTGLLEAIRYIKDNRLLPDGFDKATASTDISVKGLADEDTNFEGGFDAVTYAVAIRSAKRPLTVEAELLYQPIGFRWARNLEDYEADEPDRFTRLYRENAGNSAIRLADTSATTD